MKNEKSLNEKACLVQLNIKQWSGKKLDRRGEKAIEERYGTRGRTGNFVKLLVEQSSLHRIKQISAKARGKHYMMTLPWEDSGERILPEKLYPIYQEEIEKYKKDFFDAVGEFEKSYPLFLDEANDRLNGLFSPADYPLPEEISSFFEFKKLHAPVPASTDFRLGLDESALKEIRQEIEERVNHAEQAAMNDLYQRVLNVLDNLINKLSEKSPIFRDSLIGNVTEISKFLDDLNIAEDENLKQIKHELDTRLAVIHPDYIRGDGKDAAREEVVREAIKIKRKISM